MKNKNPLKFKYDKEAEALYISIGEGKVTRTEEWRDGYIVDYNEDNHIIGIEMLGVERDHNTIKIQLPEKALSQ